MVKQQQSPHEKIDKGLKRVGVDVTEELQAIRGVLPHLRTKILSIQEDSYYRNSMVSAVNLLTAATDMLESSSRLGFMNDPSPNPPTRLSRPGE